MRVHQIYGAYYIAPTKRGFNTEEAAKERNNLAVAAPEMLKALECVKALDMPYKDGKKILSDHGFSYQDRFTTSATEFVSSIVDSAINKAKGGNHGKTGTNFKSGGR